MILKTYIFAQNAEYQQYTSDYSSSFLKLVCKNSNAENQIAIHRDGNLIYYAYAHKNPNNEIYGLCVVCGELCSNIRELYDYFLKSLENQAKKGNIFHYDEQGIIRKKIDTLSSQPAEIDSLFKDVKGYLDNKSFWEPLPPEDLSVPLNSVKTLSFSEDTKPKILEAIKHYHNVYITLENSIPSSYSNTVAKLNSEKKELLNKINSLEDNIAKLDKQKRQVTKVVFLIIALSICIIGLLFFRGNVQRLNSENAEQKSEILTLSEQLHLQGLCIDSLQALSSSRLNTINSLRLQIESFNKKISSIAAKYPISISNIEIGNVYSNDDVCDSFGSYIYSSNTMYLEPQITYEGIRTGETINLKIKWYKPDGTISTGTSSPNGYSQSRNLYVSSGENVIRLQGWGNETKGHWVAGSYRIEIWYDDICLKAKSFTIH